MNLSDSVICICGSGKSYKNCCMNQSKTGLVTDISLLRFMELEESLLKKLSLFSQEFLEDEDLDLALEEFFVGDLESAADLSSRLETLFMAFVLFSWEIDVEVDSNFDSYTVAEVFLQEHGDLLSTQEKRLLLASNRPKYSFYEVRKTRPGQSLSLRDILTDKHYEAKDIYVSQEASPGDILFCALGQMEDICFIMASAPFFLPPLTMRSIVAFRDEIKSECNIKKIKDEDLIELDMDIREELFDILDDLLSEKPLNIVNSEGDPINPQTLRFDITCPKEAFDALYTLARGIATKAQLAADAVYEDDKIHKVTIPWCKKATKKQAKDIILGTIHICGKQLSVEVNSHERASKIKDIISKKLGKFATYKLTVIEDLESQISSERHSAADSDPQDILSDDVQAALQEFAKAHWQKWLDEKIPALNHKTPRQAAKSKAGRELLRALLNSYEKIDTNSMNQATNLFQPDVDDLRRQLGLI